MQLASPDETRSVGENASPFPLLSLGASVIIDVSDFKCVERVRSSPS